MNYKKIYDQLISKGQDRQHNKSRKILKIEIGLVEQHHIIPRSMGGGNDSTNLVFLTPEEHVVAHLLLAKIYKTHATICAANWMTYQIKNNKHYGWVRREFATIDSVSKIGIPRTPESIEKQRNTILEKYKNGYKSPITGQILTQEHKENISKGNKGKIIMAKSKSSLSGYILRYGTDLGTEKYKNDSKKKDSQSLDAYIRKYGEIAGIEKYNSHCTTLSENMSGENNHFYGKTHTDEAKGKISKSTTGKSKIRTNEHNLKIGQANVGRTHSLITCPHCNTTGGCTTMKRWHFDNCKDRPGGAATPRKTQPTITCPHCNKSGNGPRMKSNHFDYCKQKSDK